MILKTCFSLFFCVIAMGVSADQVAVVTHLSGVLVDQHPDGTEKILSVGSNVIEGDVLKTSRDTYTRLKFVDGSEVVLRPVTEFRIEHFSYTESKPESDNLVISLIKGGMRSVSGLLGKRNRDRVIFNTPTATIGIRGTHWGGLLCPPCDDVPTITGQVPKDGTHVDVVSGSIIVTNAGGSEVFNAGEFGFIQSPNVPPIHVPAGQGVPVTMPTSISVDASKGRSVNDKGDSSCSVAK